MKKLKLKLQDIEGAEILSRDQLKTVMGGSDEGGAVKCSTGPCTLTIQGSDGSYVTRNGTCQGDTALGGTYYARCFCDVGLGSDVKISSNGGISRCTL